jgi:hypothetical protein
VRINLGLPHAGLTLTVHPHNFSLRLFPRHQKLLSHSRANPRLLRFDGLFDVRLARGKEQAPQRKTQKRFQMGELFSDSWRTMAGRGLPSSAPGRLPLAFPFLAVPAARSSSKASPSAGGSRRQFIHHHSADPRLDDQRACVATSRPTGLNHCIRQERLPG